MAMDSAYRVDNKTSSTNKSAAGHWPPPNAAALRSLQYYASLRPSTLLHVLISCAPVQFPSPMDVHQHQPETPDKSSSSAAMTTATTTAAATALTSSGQRSVNSYVDMLTTLEELGSSAVEDHHHHEQHSSNDAADAVTSDNNETQLTHLWRLFTSVLQRQYASSRGVSSSWVSIDVEAAAWVTIQKSLDILMQRAAVVQAQGQKQDMRSWYETVVVIGGHAFPTAAPSSS